MRETLNVWFRILDVRPFDQSPTHFPMRARITHFVMRRHMALGEQIVDFTLQFRDPVLDIINARGLLCSFAFESSQSSIGVINNGTKEGAN